MNLIFVGPQGSGKGTQAKIIADKLGLCHISTGDLLRNATGDFRKEIDSYVTKGALVPDELIIDLLEEKFHSKECKRGYILDGFPRNLKQAEYLDKITQIHHVVEINISDSEAIKRLGGRLNCKNCGAVFNVTSNPPKKKGSCDSCGGELYTRDDDKEEAIKKRLQIYHADTKPILKRYSTIKINGEQGITKVTSDILAEISS